MGPKIIDSSVKKRMKAALKDIQDGKFAKAWVRQYKTGYKQYNKLLKDGEKHGIEKVGTRLRSMMPWMQNRTVKGAQAAYYVAGEFSKPLGQVLGQAVFLCPKISSNRATIPKRRCLRES